MRVYEVGDGPAEVAIVVAIHGDEPCGVRAVERLIAEEPSVERSVKFVVANEEALDADQRYLDEDLNRAFPGDPDADTHEGRLASRVAAELTGCTTLSIHSTQSFAEPFAVMQSLDEVARAVCPHLPVEFLVQTDEFAEGRLVGHPHTIEVESGLQGTDEAAENAYWLSRAFLAATGALSPPTSDDVVDVGGRQDVDVYRLTEELAKPDADSYEVLVRNFERVESGETWARVDGNPIRAEEPFVPVLVSARGYENQFGYAATHVGSVN